MLDLFDDVLDYDATAKRVDYYLSIMVTKLLRIANESPAALKPPSMDGMPKSPHYENVIVCDTIGYSRSQFAHLKKEALNEFADRFECVKGGRDLHVYDE